MTPRVPADRLAAAARGIAFVALSLGLSLSAGPLHAQKADRDKPIHLEADRVTMDDARQIATFVGNVVLTQGSMILRGDRMEVRQDKAGFRQGTTWGNLAYFRQKREGSDEFIEGWAERIEYDGRADRVQMFNRAMMKRGQDEVRGNHISYDARTEFFQVTGGPAKTAGGKPSDGRVRAIIQPTPSGGSRAAPPVSLQGSQTVEPTRGDPGAGKP
jgi:lipopolysaccharide export system protein LptA